MVWHHVLDLVREFRLFSTGGAADCICTTSLLILVTFISLAVGFWIGCLATVCCVSPRFRSLLWEIIGLVVKNFATPGVREQGHAVQLRERLREYRA